MKKEMNSLNISLLSDRVLILPENGKNTEQKTATGIILATKEKEIAVEIGKVVAVGSGRRTNDGTKIEMDVKIGDRVYFKKGYDTEEVELSGVKYVLLGEANVYAIIK